MAPDPAELSELLDRYEVSELITCGGMGAVYRGQQLLLQREVAIKVLPGDLSRFEAAFQRGFRAEARMMAQLTHPNLIRVYDFGEIAGMLYLVMEFVNGVSLFDAENGEAVEALQAVEIVAGVAAGVGHAHQNGILHRDIKPANILLTSELDPKLGGFGMADVAGNVASGIGMGTPAYMAPEVLLHSASATPASDVFSLGMILHELLTGMAPSAGEPANTALVPNLRDLRHLVRKALTPEPLRRFRDAEAMAMALDGWLKDARKSPSRLLTGATPSAVAPVGSGMPRIPPRQVPGRTTGRFPQICRLSFFCEPSVSRPGIEVTISSGGKTL